MNILVIGGTGTVGSEVVRRLLDKGAEVRVMTRSWDKAAALPEGVHTVIGDLMDESTLEAAYDGIASLFLLVPVGPNETQIGLAGVQAAKTYNVKRIVYLSVADAESASYIPHFGSKVPIENAVRDSGLEHTILRPNNFYQNDIWFKDAILQSGVYPQPIGMVGLSRVDVRDIADAAVHSLTKPGHNGDIYTLGGPEALTGEDVAKIYSRHLGREIRYGGNDLNAWEIEASKMLPDYMVHDFRIMYDHFQKKGLLSTPADMALQRKALGHEPRTFDAYVGELVASWAGSPMKIS